MTSELEGKLYCRDGEPEYDSEELRKLKEFFQTHKNQFIDYCFTVGQETRRSKANRHYWACLKVFCPQHFQTPQKVHEHYTKEHLQQNDVFEYLDNFQETLNTALNEIILLASTTRKTIEINISKSSFGIRWVKSTTVLNKKDFYEYVQQVLLAGQELGLEFPELK